MENYFWTTQAGGSNDIYVLIIYDIVENKTRNAFAKKMAGYGFRVQKSAFEALISRQKYNKLMTEIPKLIDESKDSVRVYRMTGFGEVSLFGQSVTIEKEDVIII